MRAAVALRKGLGYVRDVHRSHPPVIFYASGSPDSVNLGDNALFKAYKRIFHRCSFVRYRSGGRLIETLTRAMRVSGCGMLGGGTLINRWGFSAAEECQRLFDRFFVFGTGVAQESFWSGRGEWKDTTEDWKRILERADYVGVRGPLSQQSLQAAGLRGVEVIGDPVLIYAGPSVPAEVSYERLSLGLNLRHASGETWGDGEEVARECSALASRARAEGWRVKWFVVNPEDKAITQHAARESGTEGEIFECYRDHFEFISEVARMGVFVGTKLHAVVLASCAYVPPIMLEYRPKCRDFMMSIDHEDSTRRTDRVRADELWEMVERRGKERDLFSRRLFESVGAVKGRMQERAEEVMGEISAVSGV